MDWHYEPDSNTYMLTEGDVRCRVWYTKQHTWATSVMYRGIASASYNLDTVAGVQGGCAAQTVGTARRA